jgi:HKD family nuclease
MDGLTAAQWLGLRVRLLNLSRATFHPKLYLARHGQEIAAAVGSANLTSGLTDERG